MSHLLLLATEAADGGPNPGPTIAVVILLAALAAFAVAYYLVGPGRRRGPKLHGDIPLAMRPYHSDEELETTGMERAMAWGAALAAFCAVFLPLYWLIEPTRINEERDNFFMQDVAFGREQFGDACVTCHGENAQGGFAAHPNPEVKAPWPAPPLNNIMARYEDSEVVEDVEDFMITTIKRGRAGTPMPAWSAAYGGAMNDQQIEAIVTYLLSIQTGEVQQQAQADAGQQAAARGGDQVFQDNCARCHGQDANGRVGPSLHNVFARYGGGEDADDAANQEAAEAIRHTIVNGRQVPGVGMMPPFGDTLSEEQITAVIDYLRSIQTGEGLPYPSLGQDPTLGAADGEEAE